MEINGETIRQRRRELDWTQSDLADKIGVSITTIQNYEAGKQIPSSKKGVIKRILFEDNQPVDYMDQVRSQLDNVGIENISWYIAKNEEEFFKDKVFENIVIKRAYKMAIELLKGK
ncbi:helix-turn-helix domain-containing protein [Abyssalbus ytuae]|uniref:Helix-turn-helix transcriptional regulator n=1 Tax=Abyssalbus ytuae TaxID=2926907 RepID=A0A9E6ZQB3_9FLAO|nr:helix-turn-helix transcriptional regulator [Abyssalbus ytuae]UOB18615.1 helix-turn-helix transcriptional regulator [Abyssalbus ytuae]